MRHQHGYCSVHNEVVDGNLIDQQATRVTCNAEDCGKVYHTVNPKEIKSCKHCGSPNITVAVACRISTWLG